MLLKTQTSDTHQPEPGFYDGMWWHGQALGKYLRVTSTQGKCESAPLGPWSMQEGSLKQELMHSPFPPSNSVVFLFYNVKVIACSLSPVWI